MATDADCQQEVINVISELDVSVGAAEIGRCAWCCAHRAVVCLRPDEVAIDKGVVGAADATPFVERPAGFNDAEHYGMFDAARVVNKTWSDAGAAHQHAPVSR